MSRAFFLLASAANLRSLAAELRNRALLLDAILFELRAELYETEALR